MKELLERPKGYVKILIGDKDFSFNNAVVNNSKELQARALGGDLNYLIDTIEIWEQGAVIATASTVSSYPATATVRFTAVFDKSDFSGHFDKIVLRNSQNGPFSEVTGLNYTKPASDNMAIRWEIVPQ